MHNNQFHCFIPVDFEKATKDPKTGEELIKIKGIISTAEEDQQGEYLDPNGFDLSKFVTTGQINWNHTSKDRVDAIVGHPVLAKVVDGNKVYMEGVLYPDMQKTKDIINLAKSLEKYGQGRKLGYSIEGRAVTRDPLNPKRITKAIITGVAITPCPVNLGTSLELMKGLVDENVEKDFDIIKSANGGETEFLLDVTNQETGIRYTMDKNFCIKVEKAMTTQSGSGKTVMKESLEGAIKNLVSSKDEKSSEIKKALITISKAVEQGRIVISKGGVGSGRYEHHKDNELEEEQDKLRVDVDKLIKLKKKLFPNPDITSPMSDKEKELTKDIAELFSQLNSISREKRIRRRSIK